MSSLLYHKELTDAKWHRIKSLFEKLKKVGRPSLNPRTVLNGILWILSSGAAWRDLPNLYGNWNSLYHKFRQWCDCTLLLLKLVNRNADNSSLLEIDSTFKTKQAFDNELYKQYCRAFLSAN
ncbi:MAG: transposase [Selenomonadaceae bacterium]|nr:transposase [Selenomonadaceae bacterium]